MSESEQTKTEQPTPHKMQEARERRSERSRGGHRFQHHLRRVLSRGGGRDGPFVRKDSVDGGQCAGAIGESDALAAADLSADVAGDDAADTRCADCCRGRQPHADGA